VEHSFSRDLAPSLGERNGWFAASRWQLVLLGALAIDETEDSVSDACCRDSDENVGLRKSLDQYTDLEPVWSGTQAESTERDDAPLLVILRRRERRLREHCLDTGHRDGQGRGDIGWTHRSSSSELSIQFNGGASGLGLEFELAHEPVSQLVHFRLHRCDPSVLEPATR
jgi:hypothetical protein